MNVSFVVHRNTMSVTKFKRNFAIAMMKELEGMRGLADALPNRETDHPDTFLRWPLTRVWSAMIEDELEASGYSVLFASSIDHHGPSHFLITFSEETKNEMEEEIRDAEEAVKTRKRHYPSSESSSGESE